MESPAFSAKKAAVIIESKWVGRHRGDHFKTDHSSGI
jgi:hypothetical protein